MKHKFETVLLLGMAAVEIVVLFERSADVTPASVGLVVAALAALAFVRTHPLPVLAFTIATALGVFALGDHLAGLPICTAVYFVGRSSDSREMPVAVLASFGALALVSDNTAFLAVGTFFLGRAHRSERELDRHRTELEVAAAQRERTAIARELHDIVAHSVSVMLVGVRGARDVIATEPHVAYETLGRVEASAERSLAELRRSLGLLRDPDHSVALAPQPSLRDLEQLFADTGFPVRLHASGALRDLPDGLELSVYRLVQEALTNVRKHGQATRADVFLRFGEDTLGVEIVDDGVGDTGGDGQGLVGMRERVAMLGGELEHGSRPEGGYRVAATLPIP